MNYFDELPDRLVIYKARSQQNAKQPRQQILIEKIPNLGGGEGGIYQIPKEYAYCVKIFKRLPQSKIIKLNSFFSYLSGIIDKAVANYISSDRRDLREFFNDNVAIPRSRVYEEEIGDSPIGYMMQYFEPSGVISLEDIMHEAIIDDKEKYQLLIFCLYEIVYAINLLNKIGIAFGDCHGNNILVRKRKSDSGARIIIIDVDSAQLSTPTGFYANDVWRLDSRPPEISKYNSNVTEAGLVFSLSIIIYRVLMGGLYPFQYLGQKEDDEILKMKGVSPLRSTNLAVPGGRKLSSINKLLRRTLAAGIDPEPSQRPSLDDLLTVLSRMYN